MTLIVVFLFFFASTEQVFDQHCAACHGVDARGTAKGPGLATNPRVAQMSIAELSVFLEHGNPATECQRSLISGRRSLHRSRTISKFSTWERWLDR